MRFSKEQYITLLVIGVITLIAVSYTWLVVQRTHQQQRAANPAVQALTPKEGTAPYTDLSGNELSLTDHFGEVLVMNSWASWSPDSRQELAALADIAGTYADRGVKVLAVNRAEPPTTAERFLRHIDASGSIELVLDPDDHYYESIGGYAMPETVFYDRAGNIIHHHHGVLTADQMKQYVEQALTSGEEE